jgi:hypothetical protein
MDPGGDERVGYILAGGILIALGWGLAVLVNLLLHCLAGSGGMMVGGHEFTATLGAHAWATFALGVFAGGFGVVLVALGRASPKGQLVLPGYDY